ncbi:MAG: hypothetical protein ACJ0BS_00980 [Paracoccaceae bacterium]
MEKTGLKLTEKKLSSLSKMYTATDIMGDKIFRAAKNFVNPETSFLEMLKFQKFLEI